MKLFVDDRRLSPYTYSVQTALREKNIEFELVEVSFEKNQSTTPAFMGRTFTDLIPAIDDDGFILSESLAILEYLEDRFASPKHPSVLPSDLKDRARARMLLSWYRCGMSALRNERSTETIFYPETRANLAAFTEMAKEEIRELTEALGSMLKPGADHLFDRWSIVDAETALMLQRLVANGEMLDPRLKAYAEKNWNRPSVREFVSHRRPAFRSYYL
jgi:glutathione S-transferase